MPTPLPPRLSARSFSFVMASRAWMIAARSSTRPVA